MKNIFFATSLMWTATPEEIAVYARNNEYEGLEIWVQQFSNHELSEWPNCLAAYGLKAVVHAPSWDLNFASDNVSIRKASMSELKRAVDFASSADLRDITVHPPRYTLVDHRSQSVARMMNGFKSLVSYGRRKGVHISLEVMENIPKELVCTLEALQEVLSEVNDIWVTLDIAHCENTGAVNDYLNQVDQISKIHISNKIGTKRHTPLDEGDYDFTQLLPILKNLDKPLVVEGYQYLPPYTVLQRNTEFLKRRNK